MGCSDVCVYMGDDFEPNEFFTEAWRKARKPYKCCECGDPIAVGERHHVASGKSDGEMYSFRTCVACDEIGKAFCCGGRVFTMLWGEIREQLFPHWNPIRAIDCLAKLTTDSAVAKMKAKYAAFQKEQPEA